ncbi:MAG: hypothetical protein LBQ41_02255 [Candidatus Ancillula sp.]|jgi:UDP-N-acetylmuramoylalanine--D-glutamate ligase|nr:hypothetical protein [Candidatus Ancillula sp.]
MTKYIGVTGSVGKSTTVHLIAMLLRNYNFTVHEATTDEEITGALGKTDVDFVIVEFSNRAAVAFESVSLDISVLLNVNNQLHSDETTEDEYSSNFAKVYENTKGYCVFNASDRKTDELVQEAEVVEGTRAVGFCKFSPKRGQIGVVEGVVTDRAFYADEKDPLRFLSASEVFDFWNFDNLKGPNGVIPNFLVDDILAAVVVAKASGVSSESIAQAMHQFSAFPGQNELVFRRDLSIEPNTSLGEVLYVNDVKSITPVSTFATMSCYRKNSVILICGGETQGLNYSKFVEQAQEYLLGVVLVGSHNSPLYQLLRAKTPNIPVYVVEPNVGLEWVDNAVDQANKLIFGNDIVLLSPAADVSRFNSVEDVSARFWQKVEQLHTELTEISERLGLLKH